MDFLKLFKQSWHLTLRHWRLWFLTAAMSITFLPALLVGSSFGSITAILTLPLPEDLAALAAPLLELPAWSWFLIALVSLMVMVISTAASCALQAAAMRATAACADNRPLSLPGALRLGRERFKNILKLSILYGVLIAFLALLPPLLLLAVPDDSFVNMVSSSLYSGVAPLNSILGVIILLVLISVALEDVRAEAAAGRTWKVFKKGWKQFLGVTGISLGTGIIQALLIVPLLVLITLAIVMQQGWGLVLLCAAVSIPLVLLAWLGTGVFTLVLYTLVYRAAAEVSEPVLFEQVV